MARFPCKSVSISPPLRVIHHLTSSFQNLTRALCAIRQRQGHNLVVPWEFDLSTVHEHLPQLRKFCKASHIVEYDQWTVDTADGVVPNPWLDAHHAGVYYVGHDGGFETFPREESVFRRLLEGLSSTGSLLAFRVLMLNVEVGRLELGPLFADDDGVLAAITEKSASIIFSNQCMLPYTSHH
jgi:hypothetical protein